jgi:aminocarboxymuconate-semialdehyde decarboxylase
MGENKICLGSDYPFPLGEHHPGKLIEETKLDSEIKDKILFKNAMDWLNAKQLSS